MAFVTKWEWLNPKLHSSLTTPIYNILKHLVMAIKALTYCLNEGPHLIEIDKINNELALILMSNVLVRYNKFVYSLSKWCSYSFSSMNIPTLQKLVQANFGMPLTGFTLVYPLSFLMVATVCKKKPREPTHKRIHLWHVGYIIRWLNESLNLSLTESLTPFHVE